MINLWFLFFCFLPIWFYDPYRQNRSESLYWYGENGEGGYYSKKASDASSIGQFAFWYYFVFSTAILLGIFGYFKWYEVLTNLLTVGVWHWCGEEDLGYAIVSMLPKFKHPPKYYEYHPATKICGIELPVESYWLSKPRIIKLFKWTFKIPSLIGLICGERVPAKKFFALTVSVIILTIILSFII